MANHEASGVADEVARAGRTPQGELSRRNLLQLDNIARMTGRRLLFTDISTAMAARGV
ncbi:hypothetical protein ACX80D_16390 [Arthrobacter sp. Sr24]